MLSLFLAIAEFEQETIVERIKVGLAAARANGQVLGKPRNEERLGQIAKLKSEGWSVAAIADDLGCSRQNVYKALEGSRLKKAV